MLSSKASLKKETSKTIIERFQNVNLRKIREKKKNYQAEVVEAAEAIFSIRHCNNDDLLGQNLK